MLQAEKIYQRYRPALVWCNGKIKSYFRNHSMSYDPQYIHTGSKYYNSSHLVDEYGEYKPVKSSLYVFEKCKNDIYWMTDYNARVFQYPCCFNVKLYIACLILLVVTVLVAVFGMSLCVAKIGVSFL